jgi:hypothetical protein
MEERTRGQRGPGKLGMGPEIGREVLNTIRKTKLHEWK